MSFSPIFKKSKAIEWTAYVLEAVGKAKKYNKHVYLDVGRESTAFMMEDGFRGSEKIWTLTLKVLPDI